MIKISYRKLFTFLFLSYLFTATINLKNASMQQEIKIIPCLRKSNDLSLDNLYFMDLMNNFEDYDYEFGYDSGYEKEQGHLNIDSGIEYKQKECEQDEYILQNNFQHGKRTEIFMKIILDDPKINELLYMNQEFFDL